MTYTGTSAQAATLDGCEDCLDHAREAAAEDLAGRGVVVAAVQTVDALAADYIARGLTAPCSAHTV